ncbi:periplasmic immunogenic protein [Chlorella vulgaris]
MLLFRAAAVLLATLLVMGNIGGRAAEQTCEDPKASVAGRLTVSGMATVTEIPDTAKVNLAVSVSKPTAAEAREEAATTAESVLKAVGAVQGINGGSDITTSDISLQPNYVWVQETGTNRITGYIFTQNILVKISNLTSDTLGSVVDTAVKAGGNNLQVSSIQIDFSPALRRKAMDQARKLAVRDAAATADTLAEAAKVALGPIKSISDANYAPPTPLFMGADMAVAGAAAKETPTPVQIGTSEVTATINVEYAILNS